MASSPARTAAVDAALRKAISSDRITTYAAAATAAGCDELDLYVWDRDLAAAVLADIAIVEVALRNAVHDALSNAFGASDWYLQDIGLDDRSRRALAEAWNRLTKPKRTPGRVVARLMLGFWAGLLDAGGYYGQPPQAFKADYEQLFRSVLRRAFPGGRTEARAAGAQFTREWVHSTVTVIQDLRNRAAHHEPLVGGVPLNGQKDKHGNPVRLTVQQGHEACLLLARMLDRDLGSWLALNSTVPALLASMPSAAALTLTSPGKQAAPAGRYRPGRSTKLSSTAPCLYPGCGQTVAMSRHHNGHLTYFCSDSCRVNYRNIRRQLLSAEAALVTELGQPAGDSAVRSDGHELLRLTRWHLARFAGLPVSPDTSKV